MKRNSKNIHLEAVLDNTKMCYKECVIRKVMRKSRLSKQVQHRLIEHFVAVTTARCVAELIGVNKNTAVYY